MGRAMKGLRCVVKLNSRLNSRLIRLLTAHLLGRNGRLVCLLEVGIHLHIVHSQVNCPWTEQAQSAGFAALSGAAASSLPAAKHSLVTDDKHSCS